jgi:hypothetical protein
MEVIKIKPSDDTPSVTLDSEKEVFEMSGRSLPEDVNEFYDPLLNWLEEYKSSPNKTTNFTFKMQYFNTASSKVILDVMLKLEELMEAGNEVKILWYFEDGDEDMEEAGEEFSDIVEVPFDMHSY